MKAISLASALLLSVLAFALAPAAPAAPVGSPLTSSGVAPVQYSHHSPSYDYSAKKKAKKKKAKKKKAKKNKKYRRHHRRRYQAGHRYRHAPRGWRRYKYRPFDWYFRGCIQVGPLWFCP
jgi:Ni/Co efflux regulator RcnB